MYYSIDVMSDCSERVPYQIPEHPIYAGLGRLSIFQNMEIAYHWHDDLEFGVVLSGHMVYAVNGETFTVKEGEGVFINARQLHNHFSDDGTDCQYMCVLIHPSALCGDDYLRDTYITPLTQNEGFSYLLLRPQEPWQGELLQTIRQLHAQRATEEAQELMIQSLAYRAAALLYGHMPKVGLDQAPVDRRLTALRNMVGFVQRHYDETIKLSDIAAAGGVSESTCCAIFRKQLRQTPMGYLARYRLEKATELLNNPDLSVTEVALAVGFSGPSYFAESFREHMGLSPMEYRKQKTK